MKQLNLFAAQTNVVIPKATQPLIEHIYPVMRQLNSKDCPSPALALRAILHMHLQPVEQTEHGITFAAHTADAVVLEMPKETADYLMRELVEKFHVASQEPVNKVLRYQWSRQQKKVTRSDICAFYTPPHLADLVKTLAEPMLDTLADPVVFDSAAGLGGILGEFDDYKVIAADIDADVVTALGDMGFTSVHNSNGLKKVARTTYGIADDANLVIVGNPPFSGKKSNDMMKDADLDVRTRDMGLSFLLAAAKLKPAAICMLHPLSFLTKRQNFKQLQGLSQHYRLVKGVVFSSADFEPALSQTPFPVVAALYVPGTMTYDEIRQFSFEVFEQKKHMMDTGKRLIQNALRTIDGTIRKYPPTKDMKQDSDIGLYQYNFRDANFLRTRGGLSEKPTADTLPVQYAELGHYAYINCFKRYFGKHYLFGNFSPLCREADLSNPEFLDRCIYDMVMHNQGLETMCRKNPDSFVVRKKLIQAAKRKARQYQSTGSNPHQAFVAFWKKGTFPPSYATYFENYFEQLREDCLLTIQSPLRKLAELEQATVAV